MTTKNKEVEYAKKDQIDSELKASEAKVRVSMFIDGDLLLHIREIAKENNSKYQTLINQSLRELFLGEKRMIKIEDFEELRHRIEILEAALKRQA